MDKALYGIFDSISNKRYNDAIPNYDNDDGVDIVECTQECKNCSYKDCIQDRCLFETCMKKITPFSIPFHTKFYTKCKICDFYITWSIRYIFILLLFIRIYFIYS